MVGAEEGGELAAELGSEEAIVELETETVELDVEQIRPYHALQAARPAQADEQPAVQSDSHFDVHRTVKELQPQLSPYLRSHWNALAKLDLYAAQVELNTCKSPVQRLDPGLRQAARETAAADVAMRECQVANGRVVRRPCVHRCAHASRQVDVARLDVQPSPAGPDLRRSVGRQSLVGKYRRNVVCSDHDLTAANERWRQADAGGTAQRHLTVKTHRQGDCRAKLAGPVGNRLPGLPRPARGAQNVRGEPQRQLADDPEGETVGADVNLEIDRCTTSRIAAKDQGGALEAR
ncbi:MAG TPA: hypothetical protein VGS57_09270 [Thermoanaerobaculia bacterium]|nr:hypothetical protein [Thermoanaerobaculia bacterium]